MVRNERIMVPGGIQSDDEKASLFFSCSDPINTLFTGDVTVHSITQFIHYADEI